MAGSRTDKKELYQKDKAVDRCYREHVMETAREPGGFFKASGLCQDVYGAWAALRREGGAKSEVGAHVRWLVLLNFPCP